MTVLTAISNIFSDIATKLKAFSAMGFIPLTELEENDVELVRYKKPDGTSVTAVISSDANIMFVYFEDKFQYAVKNLNASGWMALNEKLLPRLSSPITPTLGEFVIQEDATL
jgi:hypothetical protein